MPSDISISVACTLIPVHGYNLLLPNQCISEIIIRSEISQSNTSTNASDSWCIGETEWLSEKLPVIQFEKLNPSVKSNPIPGKNNIIVVVQFPLDDKKTSYFGILANQTPQVIQANNQTMDREINPKKTHDYALSYVQIKNKSTLIPDLLRIANSLQNNIQKTA